MGRKEKGRRKLNKWRSRSRSGWRYKKRKGPARIIETSHPHQRSLSLSFSYVRSFVSTCLGGIEGRAITDVRTYEPNQARSKKGEGTRKPFIPYPSGRGKFASFGRELCGSLRGRDFCHEFGRFKGGGIEGKPEITRRVRPKGGEREGKGTSLLPLLFPLSPSTVTVEKERGEETQFFCPQFPSVSSSSSSLSPKGKFSKIGRTGFHFCAGTQNTWRKNFSFRTLLEAHESKQASSLRLLSRPVC